MRDSEVMTRFNTIEGMAASDIGNIQKQTLLLRTRMDAIEKVLFSSRFGLLKVAIIQLLSPLTMAKVIQANHSKQIKEMNEAITEAGLRKPKIRQAPVSLAVSK